MKTEHGPSIADITAMATLYVCSQGFYLTGAVGAVSRMVHEFAGTLTGGVIPGPALSAGEGSR